MRKRNRPLWRAEVCFHGFFGKRVGIFSEILTGFLVFFEKSPIPLKRKGIFVKMKLQRLCSTFFVNILFAKGKQRGGIPMNKRKKWLILGMTLAGILAMAGCGGNAAETSAVITEGSAEEYVQAAKDALAAADSFAADFEAVVSMKDTGKTSTNGEITLVKEPLYVNLDTKMDFDSSQEAYTIYLEESGDAVNQYMNYDGRWTEMTMTKENAMGGIQVYNTLYNMETVLSAAEDWTIADSGDELVLTAVIPEAKVYTIEESGKLFQLAGMSGLSEVYFTGVGDVPVKFVVDGKTGAPLSYEIDLAKALETVTNNVLKELGGGTLENGVTVETYTITSQLTQLGGVTAEEIPAAAKSDAINYEKEISMLEEEKE